MKSSCLLAPLLLACLLTRANGVAAQAHETWCVELGVALNQRGDDGYNRVVENAGFEQALDFAVPLGPQIALGAAVHRNLSLLVRYDFLESSRYVRTTPAAHGSEVFEWTTRSMSLGVRGRLPLLDEWIVGYAEAGLGLGIARPRESTNGAEHTDHEFGLALRGALGVTLGGEHVGGYLEGGYTRAAILERAGETHDDGGFAAAVGVRLRSLAWWW